MRGIVDIRDFSATGLGVEDDGPRIQAAINEAPEGGIVWIPPGKYRVATSIDVHKHLTLRGSGWSNAPGIGSWIYIDPQPNESLVTPICLRAGGAVVADLAFWHRQPDPTEGWRPADYPFAIRAEADDVKLTNIMMYCPTRGILLSRSPRSIGRTLVDGFYGQPLLEGLRIENPVGNDVVRVNNVHFWSYWKDVDFVDAYTTSTAVGIHCGGCDNPLFSNLFIYRCNIGIWFAESDRRHTSKFHIANADIDICNTAVSITANGTSGQIANLTAQGRPSFRGGIFVAANDVSIQATNIRLQTFANNCIRASGDGTRLYFENLYCADWNRSGSGFPAIEARENAKIHVGRASLDFEGPEELWFGEVSGGRVILDK